MLRQRVERHIFTGKQAKVYEDICFKSARLYNFCNYHLRMAFFGTMEKVGEYELTGILAEFNQEDYRHLPAMTSQQIVKLLFKNWKSFWKAREAFKKNPSAFNGRPKLPGYKPTKGYSVCIFTNQQVKTIDGYIHFPKSTSLQPIKTKIGDNKLCQVRIIPQATCFVVEVIYQKTCKEMKELKHKDLRDQRVLSIDLGLDNLVTTINNVGEQPFIINGKGVKSFNQFYNKKQAVLKTYIGDKGTSRRLKQLTFKRNNKIQDYLHKSSRIVVDWCKQHNIDVVVIGKNDGWKQEINIGKVNNQHFVNIPHATLIEMITYKLQEEGIHVQLTEESYTSKCDHLAFEPMCHQDKYLGKRKKRGLFVSSIGRLINADVNGAIGIARKVMGDAVVRQLLHTGLAHSPVRINPLMKSL